MNLVNPLHHDNNRLFDLSGLGLLKVSGPGALPLLQGQLSCDMHAITAQDEGMGAHCNPQGRIISLFYAANIQNDFYLVMPRRLVATALAALKKYAPFFKAELQDATGQLQVIGAFATHAITDSLAEIMLPAHTGRKIVLRPDTLQTPPLSVYEDWKCLDMLDGIPAIYPETSCLFLPHDINLPDLNAVHFKKGCFTGQEIIARMHYRGKTKKHLYRALSAEILAPGDALYLQENPAATVIDCCQNVYNNQYAFLLMTDEATIMQQLQTKQGHSIQLQQSE